MYGDINIYYGTCWAVGFTLNRHWKYLIKVNVELNKINHHLFNTNTNKSQFTSPRNLCFSGGISL